MPDASDIVEATGDSIAAVADSEPTLPTELADIDLTIEGNHGDFESAMNQPLGRLSTEGRVVRFGSRLRR